MARLLLEADLSSVALARHWALEGCAGQVLQGQARDVLQLLVSEAVANAVVHGRGPVGVEIVCDDDGVHVAVSDAHPRRPVLRRVSAEVSGGRGVALIDTLARGWGVRDAASWDVEDLGGEDLGGEDLDGEDLDGEDLDGKNIRFGKTVWFDLPLH